MHRVKQVLSILIALLMFCSTIVLADGIGPAPKLIFEPVGGGKFIYDNNEEAIFDHALMNGPTPSYIMNNEGLEPDTYYLYSSHYNVTGDSGMGYDIELDVELTACADTSITINKAFFEVPEQFPLYHYYGDSYIMSEGEWGCYSVVASMLGMDITSIEDGEYSYKAKEFTPVSIELKKGETIWLSDYFDNYSVVPYRRPVHLQALLDVLSGSVNINIAAFKAGEELGDRSSFNPNANFGKFYRDYCHKGIADTLPEVVAPLSYTIDDSIDDGYALPLKVVNQYTGDDGNELTMWYTNLNPLNDKWSKYALAESDMLTLKYIDDSKLTYYGKDVPENERDNIWVFNTHHSDARQYETGLSNYTEALYKPNFEMTTADDSLPSSCCLGNYGVATTYNLKLTNDGKQDRYFKYQATTDSELIVYGTGSTVANEKFRSNEKTTQTLYQIKLPAGKTTAFKLTTLLPVNFNGGIGNQFIISDRSEKDYISEFKERPELERQYTTLLDVKDKLPKTTLSKFEGNLNNYELVRGIDGYVLRWKAWDGRPYSYYNSWSGPTQTLYFLNKDFEVISSDEVEDYLPVACTYANGKYYVLDAAGGMYTMDEDSPLVKISGEAFPTGDKLYDIENASYWAKDYLINGFKKGIKLNEQSSGFGFTDSITRGDFCRLIASALVAKDAFPTHYIKKKFSDTTDTNITALCGVGIINGYDDGTFGINDSLTREQAAAILYRLMDYLDIVPSTNTADSFTDEDTFSLWAKDAIYTLDAMGVMLGMGDGTFAPQDKYSREQSVVTIMRLIER